MEEEERARKVIGLSASNKCVVLSEMVSAMAKEIGSENEESAVVKLVEKGAAVHMKGWKLGYFEHRFTYGCCFFCISQTFFQPRNKETAARYASLGKRIRSMPDVKDALVSCLCSHSMSVSQFIWPCFSY